MEVIENTAIQSNSQASGVFVPRDVLTDFGADFLDDDWCQTWVMGRLHPDNAARCPGCGTDIPERQMHSFWDCKRVKCDRCGKYFTALTGTFLSGCHFEFKEIVFLGFLLALGVADKPIAKMIKISAENVRLWRHRFEAISQIKQISSGE